MTKGGTAILISRPFQTLPNLRNFAAARQDQV